MYLDSGLHLVDIDFPVCLKVFLLGSKGQSFCKKTQIGRKINQKEWDFDSK